MSKKIQEENKEKVNKINSLKKDKKVSTQITKGKYNYN